MKKCIEQGVMNGLNYSICLIELGINHPGIRSTWYTAYVILPHEHPWREAETEMGVPLVSQECTYKHGMEIGWDYNHYNSPDVTVEQVRQDVEEVIREVQNAYQG